MLVRTIILVLALSAIVAYAAKDNRAAKKKRVRFFPRKCVPCICEVNSGCKVPDPLCVETEGKEKRCGPLGITEKYYNEVKKRAKNKGRFEEDYTTCMKSKRCSKRTMKHYLRKHGCEKALGRKPTCSDFARIHIGGPKGYEKENTADYGSKVAKCVEEKMKKKGGKKGEKKGGKKGADKM